MVQNLTFFAPIEKKDPSQHMVYGYASTEALDSQGEIVKKDALSAALDDYMRFANIREMHQPKAVGKTKQANLDSKGLYIGVKVVDKDAWEKVEEGVYNGFSIGGRVKTMDGNEITGLQLSEISLVDRPANPEATFDVWKADGGKPETTEEVVEEVKEEVKEETVETPAEISESSTQDSASPSQQESIETKIDDNADIAKLEADIKEIVAKRKINKQQKVETPTVEKSVHHAHAMTSMASQMKDMIDSRKAAGEDTGHMEDALEALKLASAKELDKPEDYAGNADGADHTVSQAGAHISYAEKPEDLEKKDPKAQLFEDVEKGMTMGKMPTDEQIDQMMKYMDMESSERNISVLKYEIAGKIISYLEKSMKDQENADALKKEMEAIQKEEIKPVNEVPHQWDQVKILVSKLEKQMNKNTDGADGAAYDSRDVKTPDAAPNSEMSTQNSNITTALTALQNAVKLIADASVANALTEDEEQALTEGIKSLSELTSSGRYNEDEDMDADPDETKDRAVNNTRNQTEFGGSVAMADKTGSLQKMQKTIKTLEEKIEKLESMPMPIKAIAGYMTISKFDENQTAKKDGLLSKIDEVSAKLKVNPYDPALQKEANILTAEWQKFSRGEYDSNN